MAPGLTFYYRLRAYNTAGDSLSSNVVSVTIPLAPPKPTNPLVTKVTTSEIDLSWTDNASTNAHAYLILRKVGNGVFSQYATLPATSDVPGSTYVWTDTGVVPGTAYEYHVEDVNSSGNNDFVGFNAVTLTTAPTGLAALASAAAINLNWTAVAGAIQYNVYRGTTAGGETATPLAAALVGTAFVDTTAVAGIAYYYVVTAVNANINHVPALAYESAPSSEASASVTSARAVNFANGFGAGAGLKLNGASAIIGSVLQMTDGGKYESSSAFTSSTVAVSRFSTAFDFQISSGSAIGHGFTFTIQGQGASALGQSGGGLGYGNDYTPGAGRGHQERRHQIRSL